MRVPALLGFVCWLTVSALGHAADARNTPPAWNWGARTFASDFKVDTQSCSNIRVPIAGAQVTATASGEVCPVNTVAHGYYFGRRTQQIATAPIYQFVTVMCTTAMTLTGTVTNPNTGAVYPRYQNIGREPCVNRPGQPARYIYEYDQFVDWQYRTEYTVDPANLFMRCCPADT